MYTKTALRHLKIRQVAFAMEVSGYLVGSAAFKAVGTSEPRSAGSIPVRLRQKLLRYRKFDCELCGGQRIVFGE